MSDIILDGMALKKISIILLYIYYRFVSIVQSADIKLLTGSHVFFF